MSSDEAVIGTAAQNTNAITAGNDDDEDPSIVIPDPDSSANPALSNPGKNDGKKNGKQTRNQFWKENPWMRKGHTCDLCKGWLAKFWRTQLINGTAPVRACTRRSLQRGPAYKWCHAEKDSGRIIAHQWQGCRKTVASLCETELGAPWAGWYNFRMRRIYNGQVVMKSRVLNRLFHNICAYNNLCEKAPRTTPFCFWTSEKVGFQASISAYGECQYSTSFKTYFNALQTKPSVVGGRAPTQEELSKWTGRNKQ